MEWDVGYTDEFGNWWDALSEKGPNLPFPYSSGINGSPHGHMRELRIQHSGRPYRFYMRLILVVYLFCYWGEIKRGIMVGILVLSPLQMAYMMST
jgi:hypothetical protein